LNDEIKMALLNRDMKFVGAIPCACPLSQPGSAQGATPTSRNNVCIQQHPLILRIDETGDGKKGKSTDYVKRQYMGNVSKKENGIVVVTAYG
jgi:hypothetical protein